MDKGTIKWFDAVNGLGFVAPDNGGNDLALDVTALERAGVLPKTLGDGQRVSYRAGTDRFGRSTVADIRLG
jgi:CspA family cold shock protein